MRVKICGITNFADALLCCELGADALGFIFYEKSKRFIGISKAAEIIERLPSFVVKVGVFVNQKPFIINTIAKEIGLNAVQLHGNEPQYYVKKIFLPVIKSFRVKNNFDFSLLNNYKKCSFLLDTFSDETFGGTGETFDWNLIPNELRNKIILAGGVSSNNIEQIFHEIKPHAVDLSSSLESSPGRKDAIKLKEFFNKVNTLR